MQFFNSYLKNRFDIPEIPADKYYHNNALISYNGEQLEPGNVTTLNGNLYSAVTENEAEIETIHIRDNIGYVKWKNKADKDAITVSEFYVFKGGKIFRHNITVNKNEVI